MRKYLYSLKLYLLSFLQYRFDAILGLVMSNMGMLVTILFWILIYRSNGTDVINMYTVSDMITFFVVSSLFRKFIINGSGFEISGMIKSGELSKALIKPQSISVFLYCKYLSNAVFEFMKQFLFLLLIVPFFIRWFTWDLKACSVILLLLYLLVSTVISHLIWLLFGMMAFWIEQAEAVMWSFAVVLNFLSGMFIPLDFFPKWSVKILELLPFAVFSHIPAKLYMNKLPLNEGLYLLMVYIAWVFALAVLNLAVWKAGIKRYSAVGA